jgi:outer membrane protein TolC
MTKNLAALIALFATAVNATASAQPPERAPQEEEAAPPPVEQAIDVAPAATAGLTLEALYSEGGVTADEAAAHARASAPSIESARQAARAAEAGATRAWYGVLPRLELSARYTRLSDVEQPNLGEEFGFDFEFPVLLNNYAFRASATWPVSDLFITILPAYRASSDFADAQRLQAEAQELTVALSAREAYFNYSRARGALLVAEATVGQIEAHRLNVEALVNAGVAAPVDLMRVDAQLSSARVGVARAQAGVAIAARALRTLMHVEGDDPIMPLGTNLLDVPPPVGGTRAQLIARAIERRAEMRALRLVTSGREELVTARAGERWPHLAVQANYDLANPNQRVFPQTDEFRSTWDLSVVVTWSPNDTLTGQAGMRQAEAELAQARADIAALGDGLVMEVTQAYETYEAARASLESAQVGIQAAEETYRVRVEQMRAGTAVTRDLIDAETELTRARLQLIDVLIDVHLANARLERAAGG